MTTHAHEAGTVLVVDDEDSIRRTLEINLRARGFEVLPATNGSDAIAIAVEMLPDAVLLDLGLPDMSGHEVITTLRRTSDVPIVVISARDAEHQKVRALDAGADDYITKPFGMEELLARLRAALRRSPNEPKESVIESDRLTINLGDHQLVVHGIAVHLTPTEWRMIEVLIRNRGRLVTQRQLLQEVWGPGYEEQTNYLRVYVANLRQKLEDDPSRPAVPSGLVDPAIQLASVCRCWLRGVGISRINGCLRTPGIGCSPGCGFDCRRSPRAGSGIVSAGAGPGRGYDLCAAGLPDREFLCCGIQSAEFRVCLAGHSAGCGVC